MTKVVTYSEDAEILFNDPDAFGAVTFDAEEIVQQIIEKEGHRKDFGTGPNARILYYTGRDELLRAETALGRMLVEHRPRFSHGGRHEGGFLRDEVAISLCFEAPILFHEAIRRSQRIIDYVGLLAGRAQNIRGLYIGTEKSLATHHLLPVHWVSYSGRDSRPAKDKPSSLDTLLDGVGQPTLFASVMTAWLERHELWRDARWRFFNAYSRQREYDINRLVASANMFDILPQSAVPDANPLTSEVIAARDTCRKLFRALPNSPERQSLLQCLGRLGKSNVKSKVRHRANLLIKHGGEFFADIHKVTDEAVECRNFYVHGSEGSFDYERNFDMVVFFTNSLEFVFAASDLIEAGWDFLRWLTQPTSMRHPFGKYEVLYRDQFSRLSSLQNKQN